jgi:hypothetical protein
MRHVGDRIREGLQRGEQPPRSAVSLVRGEHGDASVPLVAGSGIEEEFGDIRA